jgi:hypothetical protein
MTMAIDQETRQRAEDLFIIDGMTLEAIAKELDISDRTVANWSTEGGWTAKRRDYRTAMADIKRTSMALKKELITKALETLKTMDSIDPQDMHGFRSVLAAADIKKEKEAENITPEIDRPRIFLEDMEFVAETLKEIDPEGLKILARNFDVIVGRFKARSQEAVARSQK